MPKKVIKAKNVVSFSTGEVAATAPVEEVVEAVEAAAEPVVEEATPEPVAKKAAPVKSVEAVREISEEVPPRPAPVPEDAIETRPLNLRKNRYLDETPQDADWADEEDMSDDFEPEADADDISTFAEVFIPLHDDSTATIIRKGMVIVSIIVIICCLVAIALKTGAVGGTITPDIPAFADQTAAVVSAVLSSI